MITASRYHDISCGHRVHGHESKCALLHGHNYRIHFTCVGDLDNIGRVIDFSVIKSTLCMWLEDNWDHRFLAWREDPLMKVFGVHAKLEDSIVWVPFNPTAENMAEHLLNVVGPMLLADTGVTLT
jgi:6-pyruvoyltetrahydropterin/6-carboxytetrahydropterin synthase